jgi:uncharacterized protein
MPRALRTLDLVLARRLILGRQRLAGPLPAAPARPEGDGREAIMATAFDLAGLQLDPISVVAPSHLLVLWSRLGRFDPAGLEGLRWGERRLFEYWTHAAAPTLLMRRYRSLER